MPHPRHIGKQAEDQAADYLLALGYTVITRRFKSRHGEIDLVAIDPEGTTLVFVEVKARRTLHQTPEQAVDWTKRQHFNQAVEDYFQKTGQPEFPARYDVIALDPTGLRHHQDAFRASQPNDENDPDNG